MLHEYPEEELRAGPVRQRNVVRVLSAQEKKRVSRLNLNNARSSELYFVQRRAERRAVEILSIARGNR
jgi:hypothetical protein